MGRAIIRPGPSIHDVMANANSGAHEPPGGGPRPSDPPTCTTPHESTSTGSSRTPSESLPDQFHALLEEVTIVALDHPTREMVEILRRDGTIGPEEDGTDLCGLHSGTPHAPSVRWR